MSKIYLQNKKSLAYFNRKATPEFWDKHWEIENLRHYLTKSKGDSIFTPAVKQYLPQGATVLEGGCGRGQIVHGLQYQGYNAIGIDFAEQTVERIKQAVPDLDIRLGDVRNLPIEDNVLDGYVSVGVIEHFWEGYEPILKEMYRTLKPEGFLFISFPYMSPLRKIKAVIGGYPKHNSDEMNKHADSFYQFALDSQAVISDLENIGFKLQEARGWSGLKGFKDELTWFKPWLQPIYDGKRHQRLRPKLERLFKPFASHCALLIMQKI